jgi:S1-C subfamily serine protease
MAVRVVCDFCRCVMHLSEELRGRKIKCKECGGVLAVSDDRPSVEEGFTDRRRLPPVANPPPRQRSVDARDDDDDRRSPRRRRERASSGSMTALWVAGGTGAALLLVVVVILIAVLAAGRDNPAQVAVVQNDAAQAGGAPVEQAQPAGLNPANPAAPAPQVDAAPAPLPPLVDQPPAGAVLNGEQIYNRMLRSTVWIVASHKIARHEIDDRENDNGHRALQFPQPPIPPRPQMPQIPRPQLPQVPRPQVPRPFGPIGPRMPFGPQPFNPGQNPGAPNPGLPQMPQMPLPQNPADLLPNPNQQSTLTGTVWNGSETLAGYGKLTFQFVTNTVAVMIDARETMRGTYRQNGNSVTITFGGGVIYNGTINGDNMAGSAHNGRDNWTWNVAKSAGGNVPTNPGGPGGGPAIVAKSAGSGSLIDRKHRLIVTNVHVVGTSDTVQVYFPEFDDKGELIVHSDNYKRKPGLTGRVVLREPRADIAFVQLQRLPENSMPLPVATTKAKVASQVHSVGNPGASKGLWIYSPGKVRQVFQDTWKIFDDIENRMCEYNAMKLETDSAINPGDSGGPLVNDRCTLVGVAHGHSLAANNISIFIEASEVRTLLERYYAKFGEKWTPEATP